MNQTQAIFLLASSALLFACAYADFIKYGYSGEIGPENWGNLSPKTQLCSNGQNQSPIDIVKNSTVYSPDLKPANRDYVSGDGVVVNDGFKIELRFERSAGNLLLDGKNYSLTELHWHTPSEHTIDGESFAMELHLVHQGDDGQFAIVGILYQVANNDAFLLQIKDELAQLAKDKCGEDQESQVSTKAIQTRALKRRSRKYFRYLGSLTTPPCTENVHWIILGKVRSVTQDSLNLLQAPLDPAYRSNARPTQPLNGRTVQLYDELHV